MGGGNLGRDEATGTQPARLTCPLPPAVGEGGGVVGTGGLPGILLCCCAMAGSSGAAGSGFSLSR